MTRATSGALSLNGNRAAVVTLVAICLALGTFTGCAAKLIGDYDAAIDTGVSEIQQLPRFTSASSRPILTRPTIQLSTTT